MRGLPVLQQTTSACEPTDHGRLNDRVLTAFHAPGTCFEKIEVRQAPLKAKYNIFVLAFYLG